MGAWSDALASKTESKPVVEPKPAPKVTTKKSETKDTKE